MTEKKQEKSLEMFHKEKPFSCFNECAEENLNGAQCCRYSVIRALKPKNEIIDKHFWKVHNVEVVEEDLHDDIIEQLLGSSEAKKYRMARKALMKMLKAGFKEVVYKINEPCTQLDDHDRCMIYKDRPRTCKIFGGPSKQSPFQVKGFPYTK